MNFVYVEDMGRSGNLENDADKTNLGTVYMHSHPFGEKIENVKRNSKIGFEVDMHVCFLPSYYFHPTDASQADTLYISVVIKGNAFIVTDLEEKAKALNALMIKYQKEGGYAPLTSNMATVREVAVLKVVPDEMRGKYKIGQHWPPKYRIKMATKIIQKEDNAIAREILKVMGIQILRDGNLLILNEPLM
jgi:nitroimidazol reductase NimA-like FMN-containing flavoprotein (pyridoxamine 5'-phosphate oxidase superfamily)